MKLQLNGTPVHSDAPTLAALLTAQGYGDAKIATAVNGTFVPASLRGRPCALPPLVATRDSTTLRPTA